MKLVKAIGFVRQERRLSSKLNKHEQRLANLQSTKGKVSDETFDQQSSDLGQRIDQLKRSLQKLSDAKALLSQEAEAAIKERTATAQRIVGSVSDTRELRDSRAMTLLTYMLRRVHLGAQRISNSVTLHYLETVRDTLNTESDQSAIWLSFRKLTSPAIGNKVSLSLISLLIISFAALAAWKLLNPAEYYKVTAKTNLRLRVKPTTKSRRLASMPSGAIVRVIGEHQTSSGSPWLQVQYKKRSKLLTGWASSKYLQAHHSAGMEEREGKRLFSQLIERLSTLSPGDKLRSGPELLLTGGCFRSVTTGEGPDGSFWHSCEPGPAADCRIKAIRAEGNNVVLTVLQSDLIGDEDQGYHSTEYALCDCPVPLNMARHPRDTPEIKCSLLRDWKE